jgi:putative ABC transport system permease protein
MTGFHELFQRAVNTLTRRRQDERLRPETAEHIALLTEDNIRSGMSPDEARRQAILNFGAVEGIKETYRDQQSIPSAETVLRDARYSFRVLRKTPAFTGVVVLILTAGIGASTAIFSVAYALLLRPLPYSDPSGLVAVSMETPTFKMSAGFDAALPDVAFWRERDHLFQSVAAYVLGDMTLARAHETARVRVAWVTANFLKTLGLEPRLGKDFSIGDDGNSPAMTVLITDALWRERFNADPEAVGSLANLEGRAYTIIGVLPRDFQFPEPIDSPQVLMPVAGGNDSSFGTGGYRIVKVIGRLRTSASLGQTQAELRAIQQSRSHDYPRMYRSMFKGAKFTLEPLAQRLSGGARIPVLVLLCAVALVLLIACANVANLQLVRAGTRRHELTLRAALGASQFGIVRQLLTECLVLCGLAAVPALLVADQAVRVIRATKLASMPWLASVSVNPIVLAFMVAITVLSAVAFGIAPAISGSKTNLIDILRAAPLTMSGGRGHRTLQQVLVAGQIAIALLLVICAGLLVRSFRKLIDVNPGYDPAGVLTMQTVLPTYRIADSEQQATWMSGKSQELLAHLKALPEVRYAALSSSIPLRRYRVAGAIRTLDMPPDTTGTSSPTSPQISISPDYFHAMGTPLLAGRGFSDADNENSPAVAIVNERFALQFLGGAALGKHFQSGLGLYCAGCSRGSQSDIEVVGVVADTRHEGNDQPAQAEWFVPYRQAPLDNFTIVVSAAKDGAALSTPLRRAVREVESEAPLFEVTTMQQLLDESLARRRLTMFLLSSFAGLALLLAAVGVYGVIANAVLQRRQEIGIRIALGATPGGIVRLVLTEYVKVLTIGTIAGVALAAASTRLMANLLFGIRSGDVVTFAVASAVIAAAAFVACILPASQAAAVDPLVALRYE